MTALAIVTLAVALLYFLSLFLLALIGDRIAGTRGFSAGQRAAILGLALGVYCSTWTVFGAIGTASREGLGYLPIYLGPLLLLAFVPTLWERVVALQQRHRLGSVADFLGARFSTGIAALAAVLCLFAVVPYIALQLRALDGSLETLGVPAGRAMTAVFLAIAVVFTLLFGARDASVVQRRPGLVLVLAAESVLKLAVLLAVAIWAYASLDDGGIALRLPTPEPSGFASQTVLAALAVMLLPRMFHIGVVECQQPGDVRGARWVFAGYLLLVSVAVLPLASLASSMSSQGDFLLISMPLGQGQAVLAMLAFIAGLSAASAMIIASLLALSTLISNSLVTPILVRLDLPVSATSVLWTRRIAVLLTAIASFVWFVADAGKSTLAQMGLLAFAAVAQLAPVMAAGLYGERVSSRAALAALLIGAAGWLIWLWLPQLLAPGSQTNDELASRAIAVLAANALVLLLAAAWPAALRERLRAAGFLHAPESESSASTRVQLEDVRALLDRVLGAATSSQVLGSSTQGMATPAQLKAAERALSEVLGNSARGVLTRTLGGRAMDVDALLDVLDQSARRVRSSESLLKATFEHMHQAVSVVDADLKLVAWNTPYERLFDWPPGLLQSGRPIGELIGFASTQAGLDDDETRRRTERRILQLQQATPYRSLRHLSDGRWLDIRGEPLPGGGFVTTFFDVSESVSQAKALEQANTLLEHRVAERTLQLAQSYDEKNRFVAAASHDLLQPLSAARLYLAAARETNDSPLLASVDAALSASEDLLGGLTDLSRLDTGQLRAAVEQVELGPLFHALRDQYAPIAERRALRLKVVDTRLVVQADSRLLRRILSNFLANAVRYTAQGGVLIGARRRSGRVRIDVVDTGAGLDALAAAQAFEDRSASGTSPWGERGLGLGLAGCRRLGELMGAHLSVSSQPAIGSRFSIELPVATVLPSPQPMAASQRAMAGISVLLVDNEPEVLASLEALLRRWEMPAMSASSTIEAGSILARTRVDWAIVDYALGGPETGLDWILRIRDEFPALRIALFTAETDPDLPARCKQAGIRFLKKPLKPAALRALLSVPVDASRPPESA